MPDPDPKQIVLEDLLDEIADALIDPPPGDDDLADALDAHDAMLSDLSDVLGIELIADPEEIIAELGLAATARDDAANS